MSKEKLDLLSTIQLSLVKVLVEHGLTIQQSPPKLTKFYW
jgi:hypothetical protein